MCCPLKCGSLHLVRSSLNTLWIIYPSGSSSWNASRPISFKILKSLYLFWSSFFESLFKWIFFLSNHMLSPTFNPWGFLYFLSNCFFIIFCAVSIDFVTSSQLLCRPVRKSSNLETLFVLQGCLSIGVFQSWVWIESILLPYVSYYCIGILQLLAIPPNHPVGSWHSVIEIFPLLD